MQHLTQDVRFAFRTLRKAPTATFVAVLTLALGVGLNTAIFSVVESLLLRQLPYRDADRLVTIGHGELPGGAVDAIGGFGGWIVEEWRTRSRLLDGISRYGDSQMIVVDHGDTEVLRGMRVTPEFFDTLDVRMMLGRTFLPGEDRPPAQVIVLTYDVWRRRFAGDRQIVGRMLQTQGRPVQVIGVLPRSFKSLRMTNPAETPQYFAPAEYDPVQAAGCHECFGGRVIARLRPAVSAAAATAELTAIARALAHESSADAARTTSVRVELLRDHLVGPVRRAIWILFGAVTFVMLIACANVAGLQLARATARQKEFAVRTALGGSRARLVAQLLTENLLLAIVGGIAGVFVAPWAASRLASWAPAELPRLDEIAIDARVLGFALATTVLTGLAFGIVPALSASRSAVNDVLKRTSGLAGRSAGARLREAVVVSGVALAFVLIVSTGLLARSVWNLTRLDAGFDPHDVLTLTSVVGATGKYGEPAGRMTYYRELVERVQAIHGVEAVGMTSNMPLSRTEPWPLSVEGEPSPADPPPPADLFWVSPGYFRAIGIALRRGRLLTEHDEGTGGPPGAVISESLATSRFGGGDPIGRRIRIGPGQPAPWFTVVGVAADVRNQGLDRAPEAAVYVPQAINPFHYTRLIVRTTGDPWRVEPDVRAAIRALDPAQAFFHVQLMDDYVASSLADRRFALSLFALFGVLALLLSALGVYGVVSYAVTQRTPEIGLRAALGAGRGSLFALIFRQGLALTLAGLVAGLAAASVATRLLASLLFGVASADPWTLAATAGVLTFAAALACYVPARAATRIDPLTALRTE